MRKQYYAYMASMNDERRSEDENGSSVEKITSTKCDLVGVSSGFLTAESWDPQRGRWKCLCRGCGGIYFAKSNALRTQQVKSCGCKHNELISVTTLAKSAMGETGFRITLCRYRKNQKGRSWFLSDAQARFLFESLCFYCGCPPSNVQEVFSKNPRVREYGRYIYTGIDRIDSAGGYTVGNVAPCCYICNAGKRNWAIEEFAAHHQRIREIGRGHMYEDPLHVLHEWVARQDTLTTTLRQLEQRAA